MKKLLILGFISLVILTGCVKSEGVEHTENFNKPDIKDEFCGVYINFQYCKCAFHGDYCKEIGMSKKEANKYVQSEYNKWLEGSRTTFRNNCQQANGYFVDDICNYCDQGYVAQEDYCIISSDVDLAEEEGDEEQSEEVKLPEGPYNEDCSLNQDEFNADWKKYSDIDNAIEPQGRSYEAQQALVAYDLMIGKLVETFELQRDIEIEEQTQTALNEYRQALVTNQKANLLKSFWRMAWVTTSTIKSGVQAGTAYSKIITSAGSAVQSLASGLKSFQTLIPANSDLAINKSTITGKAAGVGAKTALTAVESLGDPYKVATKFVQGAAEASVPGAELSEAEINILKQQQINKGMVDEVLASSKSANAAREAKLTNLETEIKGLETQIAEWEQKEKDRVAEALVDSCKKLTNPAPVNSDEEPGD